MTTPATTIVIDPADQYSARAAVCLAVGHDLVDWQSTLRRLCLRCGRTESSERWEREDLVLESYGNGYGWFRRA